MLADLSETVTTIDTCRLCDSRALVLRLHMGATPIAYRLLTAAQLADPEPHYPLKLLQCRDCGLAQLGHAVAPELLYPDDYPYDMATSDTAREHFRDFAAWASDLVGLTRDDLVVDIGGNTGVLLKQFNARRLNIEPASEPAATSGSTGIDTVVDFFSEELARHIVDEFGHASLVTATNVLNQIDDLQDFMAGVKTLLADDGRFVFETPSLHHTLTNLHYDHIYHEHSTFWSHAAVTSLANEHDVRIAALDTVAFRGGSLRGAFAPDGGAHAPYAAPAISESRWGWFRRAVHTHRRRLRQFIAERQRFDETFAAIGVTAKGNSLLNYCGFTADDFDFVTEVQEQKIGKYTPGGRIPIVHDDHLLEHPTDHALLTAWNFAEEIMANLADYEAAGGRFVLPMPEPHVVEAGDA